MRQPTHNTTKLPKQLLEQLGGQDGSYGARSAKGKRDGPAARKERRKAERVQKRVQQRPMQPISNRQRNMGQSGSEEGRSSQRQSPPPQVTKTKTTNGDLKPPKSILKHTKQSEKPSPDEQNEVSPISQSSMSKGVRDRLAADDAEIAALEKALGVTGKKKLPNSFEDDGLDKLLDGLEEPNSNALTRPGKRKRTEEEEWLERKRRKAQGIQDNGHHGGGGTEEEIDSEFEELMEDEEVDDEGHDELEEDAMESFEDDSSGFGSDIFPPPPPHKRVRENPYVAPPVASDTAVHAKYVPPSLRGPAFSETEALSRLRRQTQGLLNRLSEANLVSILGDVERLYRDNPRQHVTSTLTEILLSLFYDRTTLQDTFVILHAGFIAAIYKIIGTDFGAQMIQRIVEQFSRFYAAMADAEGNGKETTNLVSLLAELYNFQMIGSILIFDYVRVFLRELSEVNTELLLKIIRISGPQLRQDDPSSLKDIVLLLQPAIAKVGEANLSVRTKFMIETINNLKNNRMKTGAAASAVTSEHTIRMKKTLGSLNIRSLESSEPLRIGLDDIRNSDKRGKWWLVGASWKDDSNSREEKPIEISPGDGDNQDNDGDAIDNGSTDLLQLAREHRMNTDIRRAIFITIISASDYRDAHLRLIKLHLKKSQELEIPRVLIQCAGAEQIYNPYYTLVSRRLCSEHKLKMAFQFALWDLFKRMGEGGDDEQVRTEEEAEAEAISTRKTVNLAKMFGVLIAEGGIGLGVLKTLNLAYLQPKTRIFVELMLITVIVHAQRASESKRDEKSLMDIFMKTKDTPQVARGLQYFLKKIVSKTDVAGGRAEQETVRWACKVAGDALTVIASTKVSEE